MGRFRLSTGLSICKTVLRISSEVACILFATIYAGIQLRQALQYSHFLCKTGLAPDEMPLAMKDTNSINTMIKMLKLACAGIAVFTTTFSIRAASVTPYANDSHTVLLDHFDGSSLGEIRGWSNPNTACGAEWPSTAPTFSFEAGVPGLGQALTLREPAGAPTGSETSVKYPGEILNIPNGTLECWIYLTAYESRYILEMFPYPGACAGNAFNFLLLPDGRLYVGAWNAFDINPSATVPLYEWTHVAVSWGSAGARMYINGDLVGSDPSTIAPASGFGGSLYVRMGHASSSNRIDELRISNIQRTNFNMLVGQSTCASRPSGLVAWWSGNGAVDDLIGTNHATLKNEAGFGPGMVDQSFDLDGINDYVRIEDNPVLTPQAVTAEFWFKSEVPLTTSSTYVPLLFKLNEYDSAGAVGRGYDFYYSSGYLVFGVRQASSSYRIPLYYVDSIAGGTWHHVAGTYDATGQKLYFDGRLVDSGPNIGAIGYSSAPILLGKVNNFALSSNPFYFKGSIDALRIYNRALESNEIAAIYAAGSNGLCRAVILTNITVSPVNPTINTSQSAQFAATGTGSDGVSRALNACDGLHWTSSNPTVAVIDSNGLATPVGSGQTSITVCKDSLCATTTLSVTSLGIYQTLTRLWVYTNNPSGGDATLRSIAVDQQGNYVAVGQDHALDSYGDWRVEKISPAGTNIWVYQNNPGYYDWAQSVAVDSEGNYVVGGVDRPDSPGNYYRWRAEKFNPLGTRLRAYTSDPTGIDDYINAVAVSGSNYILAGFQNSVYESDEAMRVEFVSPAGSRLSTYTHNLTTGYDRINAAAVDRDGNIIVAGCDEPTDANVLRWKVEKLSPNGTRLWEYFGNGNNAVNGVAVDAAGNCVIVGADVFAGNNGWRVEKLDANGQLLWVYTNNPSAGDDVAASVAIDRDGNYIVGGSDSAPGDRQWRLDKLSPAGRLLEIYTNNPSAGEDWISSVAVDADGAYVVAGGDFERGTARWRVEKLVSLAPWMITNISVTPLTCVVSTLQRQQFHATGTFLDSRNVDLSSVCTWASSDPSVATIDARSHLINS